MKRWIALAGTLALMGCASPADFAERGLGTARTLVDGVIKRAEGVSDKVLDEVDRAEVLLAQEIVRLQKAKCRLPFTALVRYAGKSSARRARVQTHCGLYVTPAEASVEAISGTP
jgi:hypothetical protein